VSLSEEDYIGLGHTLGTPKICGSNFWEPLGSTGKLFSKGRARGALLNLPILIHFVIMECACRRGRSSERSLPAPMVIQKDLVMFSLAVAAPTFCISRESGMGAVVQRAAMRLSAAEGMLSQAKSYSLS